MCTPTPAVTVHSVAKAVQRWVPQSRSKFCLFSLTSLLWDFCPAPISMQFFQSRADSCALAVTQTSGKNLA